MGCSESVLHPAEPVQGIAHLIPADQDRMPGVQPQVQAVSDVFSEGVGVGSREAENDRLRIKPEDSLPRGSAFEGGIPDLEIKFELVEPRQDGGEAKGVSEAAISDSDDIAFD